MRFSTPIQRIRSNTGTAGAPSPVRRGVSANSSASDAPISSRANGYASANARSRPGFSASSISPRANFAARLRGARPRLGAAAVRDLARQQHDTARRIEDRTVALQRERVGKQAAAERRVAVAPIGGGRFVGVEEHLVRLVAQHVLRPSDDELAQEVLGRFAQPLLHRAPLAANGAEAEHGKQQRLEQGEEQDQEDQPRFRGNPAQPIHRATF